MSASLPVSVPHRDWPDSLSHWQSLALARCHWHCSGASESESRLDSPDSDSRAAGETEARTASGTAGAASST